MSHRCQSCSCNVWHVCVEPLEGVVWAELSRACAVLFTDFHVDSFRVLIHRDEPLCAGYSNNAISIYNVDSLFIFILLQDEIDANVFHIIAVIMSRATLLPSRWETSFHSVCQDYYLKIVFVLVLLFPNGLWCLISFWRRYLSNSGDRG